MRELMSEELGFPWYSMLAESTLRALDTAEARGFIDPARVGIGGVSTGTYVPLLILQRHDRIAAISISGSSWGPHQYYWPSLRGRELLGIAYGAVGNDQDWRRNPRTAEGRAFWDQLDITAHIAEIEAPILMHHPAFEAFTAIELMRHMADAGRPYDAYIYPNETHLKWQPAHLRSIMNRNLDWFRFWLQDHVDSDPTKSDQYSRWMHLRELQCHNPLSLRDYCSPLPRTP
jgi:dipeptidyl aminopeptidase/acylaminoacyl peptidase